MNNLKLQERVNELKTLETPVLDLGIQKTGGYTVMP